jgi:hypothetical protein
VGEKMNSILRWHPPQHFTSKSEAQKKLGKTRIFAIIDEIKVAIEELYDIKYPEQKDEKNKQQLQEFIKSFGELDEYGSWVFYPWSGYLVHFPTRDDLRALRTSRNRNLITNSEQKQLYAGTILIIGMSVGSNVVEALIAQGIGGKLVLADMDYLEPSNFNRIRASYHDVGVHKVDAIAKKVSEIDPYIEQIHYLEGWDEDVSQEILTNNRPDLVIDEMDDVRMKLRLRLLARSENLPVIMAADDGDNILLDIERYDLHKDLPLLHGKIPQDIIDHILSDNKIDRADLGMLIGKYFVGFENTPLRMFESLSQVGRTLPSWPQLGGAAALAGVTLAYAAKKILLSQPLAEGRFVVGPDDQLDPNIKSAEYLKRHEEFVKKLQA